MERSEYIGFDAVDVETPKTKEFISSSHQARLKRIARLTQWIKTQKPKLLSWLNGEITTLGHVRKYGFTEKVPLFWFKDEKGVNRRVNFKDLPTQNKQRILARYVRRMLRAYIGLRWRFCEETTKNYCNVTMREIGCHLERNHWHCDLGLEGN